MPRRTAAAALSLLAPSALIADPLVTDRPDFTESASAVEVGRLQIEMGHTAIHDDGDEEHHLPETLLRVGFAERTELRLGWSGVRIEDGGVDGADAEIGGKHIFDTGEGSPLGLGLIAAISLPTGGSDASDGVVIPGVKFLWSYDLSERLSVAGNVNAALPESSSGDRIGELEASCTVALGLTDSLGAYIEYFGVYPLRQEPSEHYANAGLTWLLSDDLQLDIRVGAGLNESADDVFAGAGFAVRF